MCCGVCGALYVFECVVVEWRPLHESSYLLANVHLITLVCVCVCDGGRTEESAFDAGLLHLCLTLFCICVSAVVCTMFLLIRPDKKRCNTNGWTRMEKMEQKWMARIATPIVWTKKKTWRSGLLIRVHFCFFFISSFFFLLLWIHLLRFIHNIQMYAALFAHCQLQILLAHSVHCMEMVENERTNEQQQNNENIRFQCILGFCMIFAVCVLCANNWRKSVWGFDRAANEGWMRIDTFLAMAIVVVVIAAGIHTHTTNCATCVWRDDSTNNNNGHHRKTELCWHIRMQLWFPLQPPSYLHYNFFPIKLVDFFIFFS